EADLPIVAVRKMSCDLAWTESFHARHSGRRQSLNMHFKTRVHVVALLTTIAVASLTAQAQRASVETIQFQSKLINATLPYNVILPLGYRASATTRYPVLYLLHGHGGH